MSEPQSAAEAEEVEKAVDEAGPQEAEEKSAEGAETTEESAAEEPEAARDLQESGEEETAGPSSSDSVTTAEFPDLTAGLSEGAPGSIDMLMDVDLEVKIELGRADMSIDEVLHLKKGSVVELDRLAGDPVDILVNERPVARGEILVVNDNFCVRITEILDPEAGLRSGDGHE